MLSSDHDEVELGPEGSSVIPEAKSGYLTACGPVPCVQGRDVEGLPHVLVILTISIMEGTVWYCDCATYLLMLLARAIEVASEDGGVALRQMCDALL